MFRSFLCVFLLFCIVSPILSQEKSGRKFILPEDEQDESAEIKVDSSNILVEAFSGQEGFRRISKDSFAGVIGMPEKHIRWYPAQDQENLNRMLIQEVSQSFDNSVVVFTEQTGVQGGPRGTRIIIVDTVNLVVMKIIELPFLAREIRCQGSSGKIWFLRKAQPDTLKDSSALCILDVKAEKIEKNISLITLPDRLYPHITGTFAWTLEDGNVFRYYTNGKRELFRNVPKAVDLKISPDCQFLAVITEKETQVYSTDSAEMLYRVKMVPDQTFLFLGGEPPRILIGKNTSGIAGLEWPETLYMVNKGSARQLCNNLIGSVVLDPSGRVFYAMKPKKRIEKRDSTTGRVMTSYFTTGLKPVTPGTTYKLFHAAEPGHFLLFDTAGGINKIDATPRRWKKIRMMRPWTE